MTNSLTNIYILVVYIVVCIYSKKRELLVEKYNGDIKEYIIEFNMKHNMAHMTEQ